MRQVLTQILLVESHSALDEGDEWWNYWLRWAARFSSPLPDDADDAPLWIEEVVEAFCNQQTPIARWRAARSDGS